MKSIKHLKFIVFAVVSSLLVSCYEDDPGPLQYAEQQFSVTEFDRIEAGDALVITIQYGPVFSITAKGDRRNLNDLLIKKAGTTLIARFDDFENRKHTTYLEITMPELKAANFSGATNSTISGVIDGDDFSLTLTGASVAQIDLNSQNADLILSGASNLSISGVSTKTKADVSGASLLKAYNMTSEDVVVSASGASNVYVLATKTLKADASGASVILYRGEAVVSSTVTGASTVQKD